ncbi:MAG TPA: sigma-54 dependent transcriptional regulator [Burkholderiaceae bacterium]|nr:sigma-54 dependent transcriptional regulator [Burkholderiaceae bacterium]
MPHALIVDDDVGTRDWLAEVAQREGFTVATAETLQSARVQLVRQHPDVLLTDLQLPDGNGMELVADLERAADTEIIVVTGHASLDSAVEALRLGATDYLTKPLEVDRLINMLRRQPRTVDLKHEIGELRDELRKAGRFGHLYGSSPAMQAVYDKMARVAPTSATVLLIGDSGTGKELAARTVHDLSKRKRAPFLAVSCGAISPQLIESELFGHEKGSFTGVDRQHKGLFERANGGTILLDEITEMPLALQVKLLRALETGTFVRAGTTQPMVTDVRIIAATNKLPSQAVADGEFREDLYHRLNVFPIQLPLLRERGNDLEMLAQRFLDELNTAECSAKRFAAAALERLYQHSWPGNVRELKNYVQRAYILADLVIDGGAEPDTAPVGAEENELITVRIGTPLHEIEERVTRATLARCGNVKKKAAEILGISLKTLYNRLEGYAQRERTDMELRTTETV